MLLSLSQTHTCVGYLVLVQGPLEGRRGWDEPVLRFLEPLTARKSPLHEGINRKQEAKESHLDTLPSNQVDGAAEAGQYSLRLPAVVLDSETSINHPSAISKGL